MRINSHTGSRTLLALGLLLSILVAADVTALSMAAGYAYAGHARESQNDDRIVLALPLKAPPGAEVRVPPAWLLHDEGLAQWTSFAIVEAGAGPSFLQTAEPTAHVLRPAPLEAQPLRFKAPEAGRFDAVWIVDLTSMPEEQRAAAHAAIRDRLRPPQIFAGDDVTFLSPWYPAADRTIKFLALLDVAAIVMAAALWIRSLRRPGPPAPASTFDAAASLAGRAHAYARQLRSLTTVATLAITAAAVFGFVALAYFISDYARWWPTRAWDDAVVLLALFAGLTLLVASVGLLLQSHHEVRRLESVRPTI